MFLSIDEQLHLIKNYVNRSEFHRKAIVNDIRMYPFLYESQDIIHKVAKLNSLEVFIPDNIGFTLGKWYPPKGSELLKLYEHLSENGLELDFEVIDTEEYAHIVSNIIVFKGFPVSLSLSKNIKIIEDYSKCRDFNVELEKIIHSYLTVIRCDPNSVKENLESYKNTYKIYIELKRNLRKDTEKKYKIELEKYFLDYRLHEFKNRIKFYQTLQDNGYTTLDEVFNKQKMDVTHIHYYKNISVKDKKYVGVVHKVYNVVSAKQMQEGYIMVAENTNPEFIAAFYKARCICVETSSELSHAAITCKELDIPLMLGAKNIFLATKNGNTIQISTNKKIINL